jgi:hypothetical protein
VRKRLMFGLTLVAAGLLWETPSLPAQNNRDDALQMVTGCLQHGTGSGSFMLLDENGKLWELHSGKVNFSAYENKRVTASGTIPAAPANSASLPDQAIQNRLDVTDIKILSNTCNQQIR